MLKNANLNVRLTNDESAALRQIAERERLKVSEFVRQLIRNEAKKLNVWPPAQQETEAQRETI